MKKSLTLTMFSGILLLALVACGAVDLDGDDPLDGTSWTLFAYRKTKPISGTTITASFEEGQISGSAGCNTYFGSYKVQGEEITITDMGLTAMACLTPEGVMDQEQTIVGFLGNAQTYKLVDGQLLIYWTNHEALTFDPQE
jgi:heat shock protein HslJ